MRKNFLFLRLLVTLLAMMLMIPVPDIAEEEDPVLAESADLLKLGGEERQKYADIDLPSWMSKRKPQGEEMP